MDLQPQLVHHLDHPPPSTSHHNCFTIHLEIADGPEGIATGLRTGWGEDAHQTLDPFPTCPPTTLSITTVLTPSNRLTSIDGGIIFYDDNVLTAISMAMTSFSPARIICSLALPTTILIASITLAVSFVLVASVAVVYI